MRTLIITILTIALSLQLFGCPDAQPVGLACGEHGSLHDDHCHCDAGYSLSAAGVCVSGPLATDIQNDESAPDTATGSDDTAGPEETAETDSTSSDGLSFTPTTTRAVTGAVNDGTHVWIIEGLDDVYVLRVEFYEGFNAPTSPGTYALSEKAEDYATCGTCIVLETDCTTDASGISCNRQLMPRAQGEVYLSAMGGVAGDRITGELRDLRFQQVTIASDYTTEVVTGGQVVSLSSWAFDMLLESLDGPAPQCGGHGHEHAGVCHCDSGYGTDPTDPANCIPQ